MNLFISLLILLLCLSFFTKSGNVRQKIQNINCKYYGACGNCLITSKQCVETNYSNIVCKQAKRFRRPPPPPAPPEPNE